MKIRIIALLSLLSVSFLAHSQNQPASRLSRDSILIGDQIDWIIPVEIEKGESYHIELPDAPLEQGVETIEKMKVDTVSNSRGKMKIEGRMKLTSFDSGSYFLPPVIVMLERVDGKIDTLFLDGPTLEVTTIPIDTATYELKDLKGQIKYPVTFKEILPWLAALFLLAALVYLVVRIIKNRKENKTFFGKKIVQDPPHIVALRSLDKIRGQKLWQNGKQKQFYTGVTDALRLYIADRYGIVTLERPSGEMLEELSQQGIDEKLFAETSELFSRADLVKFAKYSASNEENEETIPVAVIFVNSTYMKDIEEEK